MSEYSTQKVRGCEFISLHINRQLNGKSQNKINAKKRWKRWALGSARQKKKNVLRGSFIISHYYCSRSEFAGPVNKIFFFVSLTQLAASSQNIKSLYFDESWPNILAIALRMENGRNQTTKYTRRNCTRDAILYLNCMYHWMSFLSSWLSSSIWYDL